MEPIEMNPNGQPAEAKPEKGKKMASVPLETLNALIARVEQLEKSQPGAQKLEAVKEHTARMRRFEGMYLVGFSRPNWTEKDPKTNEDVYKCEAVFSDVATNKKLEMVFMDVLTKLERVEATIIDQHTEDVIQDYGTVEVVEVKDYRTVGTGNYVPVRVVTPKTTVKVLVPEGYELELDSNSLNI